METLKKLLFLPFALLYLFTISLFIMPILYGEQKWGVIGFIACWLLYLPVGILAIFSETMEKFSEKLNRASNYCMGYGNGKTVSRTIGERVEKGISNWVEITHLRILGTYDSRGYHGSPLCTKLF